MEIETIALMSGVEFESLELELTDKPELKGALKGSQQKSYEVVAKPVGKPISALFPGQVTKPASPPSPMQVAARTYQEKPAEGKREAQELPQHQPPARESVKTKEAPKPQEKSETSEAKSRKEIRQERRENRRARREQRSWRGVGKWSWSQEEVKGWWQARHEAMQDRQGGGQGNDQEQEEEKEKTKTIRRPQLARPKTGVFALYYMLTKMGIHSDGASNTGYKKEIELIDKETQEAHKNRLEQMQKAIDKEKSSSRWALANKVFSWIGSLMGILSGIALIATGVGAIAGAMLVAGGVIQLTSQLLEITGGWQKIAEKLPCDDPEKKRAVMMWMQIGIAVLCLALSGAGIIWGGYKTFSEASSMAMAMFGAVAAIGHGATTIGEGIVQYMFKDKLSEMRRYEVILAELKHKRTDLMEYVESGLDRLEQLFEALARLLEFEVELFRADQRVYR